MKNIKLIYVLCMLCISLFMLQSCSEDEEGTAESGVQFEKVSSTVEESAGTITIPIRGGSVSGVELQFDGTATEGEDFEVVSITNDGLEIQILNDDDFEDMEYVRIGMVGGSVGGNAFTTIKILADCNDLDGLTVDFFGGDYDAVEDYGAGGTYGPYDVTLVQDDENPNRFDFDNFYDSGCDAYMIFDFEAGTVHFPDQSPCDEALTGSDGTFSIDLCDELTVLTINLNFDGGDWVYRFTKH